MIKIVTDSTADLPAAVARQHNIEVTPLYLHFGEQVFKDGQDLDIDRFFDMLTSSPKLPTTSQPSPGDFVDIYKRLTADGSTVISIHLSSKLSGTYASACAARDMLPEANIHIVDTWFISLNLGWMALEAARMASAGASADAIVERLAVMKERSRLYLTVDTLEYLHKGGRIGGAQALVGTLLQMKPILILQDGRVEAFERIRTRAKAIARLKGIVLDSVAGAQQVRLGVLHTRIPDQAKALHDELVAQLDNLVETAISEVGPVIATHVGPGALGVVFVAD